MLGKLKRTLKERCPECGKPLQIREYEEGGIENGIPVYIPVDYITCSNKNCEYEREIEQKRRRKQIDLSI